MPDHQITLNVEVYAEMQETLATLRQRVAQLEYAESDRHHAESALRRSEELFRATFEQAAVGIAYFTLTGRVTHSNQRWCEIVGYNEDELLEINFQDLTHPDDLDADLAQLERLIAGEVAQYSLEKRYICKNRDIVWVTLNKSLMRSPNGEPRYVIGVIQDITERKHAEAKRHQAEIQLQQKAQDLEAALQELQQTQTQLVQSEKMSSLGQLVAGVAHEINNPVNFIHGNLKHATQYVQDMLQLIALYQECHPTPNPRVQATITAIDLDFLMEDLPKLVASMRVGADRIREIVASLRNFSRLDEAEFKTVDIHEGIDSTLLILQNRLKAKPNCPEIKIIKQYGNLPTVECFPGQLNQVFMNILANGIDAIEEQVNLQQQDRQRQQSLASLPADSSNLTPQITITTQIQGDRVLIRIMDNGPGIPEDVQLRLFDPFFTTKPVGKGTGLGMSISYQIVVEKHGGSLNCESTVGQGTAFIVTIPIHQAGMST
jgi:two-component system, NtrC family, sensor kinase